MANQYSTPKPTQLLLPIDGLTTEIPLTKGYVTIVDSIDSDLAFYKWNCRTRKHLRYAVRMSNKKTVALHRVILSRILGRDQI